jgi:hypothetical protein
MVLTTRSLQPALDREAAAARQACHGDTDPCTTDCTSCIVCGQDAGRLSLLCPSCSQGSTLTDPPDGG